MATLMDLLKELRPEDSRLTSLRSVVSNHGGDFGVDKIVAVPIVLLEVNDDAIKVYWRAME